MKIPNVIQYMKYIMLYEMVLILVNFVFYWTGSGLIGVLSDVIQSRSLMHDLPSACIAISE